MQTNFSNFRMSATTLLGRKKVEDLGFICAHEHLRMNFECSFHKSKLCSEDTNMKLKNMTNHQAAMVRQFPYHFKDLHLKVCIHFRFTKLVHML